ncbi:MAG TPA: UbiA family prenyltransferase [Syntrophobacter fumaroxidans]|nr:UbiA family prenyltransferase [Syntrophobacter fumaroxidans]
MGNGSIVNTPAISRLRLFMALSRTPHGVLDMATPALCAMLCLGAAPPLGVAALGLLTAFAGYTAVYALNDVVDYRVDRQRIRECGLPCLERDLDAVYARHPLAQGLISLRDGILWTAAWGGIALLGAYALNPVCAAIFVFGCVAEAIYCMMLKVSYLRVLVSGVVKTAGGMAAVFAVSPDPPPVFLVCLFLWLFCWEIGGQNVPNDWSDLDEDRNLRAQTVPVEFGREKSALVILTSLTAAVILSLVLYWTTPAALNFLYMPGAVLCGIVLLLVPALRLRRERTSACAAALFNRASTYPVAMFILVILSSI